MPTGRPKRATCKKCWTQFNSLSNLRRHQWAEHKEMFDNAISASKRKKAGKKSWQTRRERELMALEVIQNHNGSIPGEMTARELLTKLKDQKTFMIDVVNLIEGLIK